MALIESLVNRVCWRYWSRHPGHFLVILLLVAFGVASSAGIDFAIEASQESFRRSLTALWGQATHRIEAKEGLPEQLYLDLRRRFPQVVCSPLVTGRVMLQGKSGERLAVRLVGLDPFSGQLFIGSFVDRPSYSTQLVRPDAILWSSQLERRWKGGGGPIVCNGRQLETAGSFDGSGGRENWVVADIATAQELTGQLGRLSSISLRPTPSEAKEIGRWLTDWNGVQLQATGSQSTASLALANSLFLNLRALSGLSALVGAFLVYQAYHFSFLVLRPQLAQLRRLGVTSFELVRAILWESTMLGLCGSLLGCLFGIGLARGIVGSLATTLSDLYFQVQVSQLPISAWILAKAVGLGLVVSWGSLAPHVWRLFHMQPANFGSQSANEELARGLTRWLSQLALIGIIASGLGLKSDLSLVPHLGCLGLLILSCAALTPVVVAVLSRASFRLLSWRGPLWLRLGWRSVHDQIELTAFPLAALSVALSAVISIETMVGSFRSTLNEWLLLTLRSDIYISQFDEQAQREGVPLPKEFTDSLEFQALARSNRVQGVRTALVPMQLPSGERKNCNLICIGPWSGPTDPAQTLQGYRFLDQDRQLIQRFAQSAPVAETSGTAVCVSEPFASRNHCRVGQELVIEFANGPRRCPVAGIFVDFTTDAGYVLADAGLFRSGQTDPGWSALAVDNLSGRSNEEILAQLEKLPGAEVLELHSNRQLRELSQTIFERTFVVTAALRWVALLLSLAGMAAALTLLFLQQTREWLLLRALGMTAREAENSRLVSGFWLGIWTGVAAIPLGLLQAYVMVSVIQKSAFGWSLDFQVPSVVLWTPLASGLCCQLAAGLANRRLRKTTVSQSLLDAS